MLQKGFQQIRVLPYLHTGAYHRHTSCHCGRCKSIPHYQRRTHPYQHQGEEDNLHRDRNSIEDRTLPYDDLTNHWGDGKTLKAILWEGEESRSLKSLLRSSFPVVDENGIETNKCPYDEFVGLVGPEGGFSLGEVEQAQKWDFIPVSLGYRILRAETAAITMVAVIQYEWGDLDLG